MFLWKIALPTRGQCLCAVPLPFYLLLSNHFQSYSGQQFFNPPSSARLCCTLSIQLDLFVKVCISGWDLSIYWYFKFAYVKCILCSVKFCEFWQIYSVMYSSLWYYVEYSHHPKRISCALPSQPSPSPNPLTSLICFLSMYFCLFKNVIWIRS